MRLGTGPRFLTYPQLRTYDTRLPLSRRHLSVSLTCLHDALLVAEKLGIAFYRMASQTVTALNDQDMPEFWRQLEESESVIVALRQRLHAADFRLTAHPMLDIQLGSDNEEVRERGLASATAWGELMQRLLPGQRGCVVVHVGGSNSSKARDNFLRHLDALPPASHACLAIENDHRHHSLEDALWLWRRSGLPVVWDYLHWCCLRSGSQEASEAFQAATATWPAETRPEIHFSSPNTSGKKGKPPALGEHAEYVDPFAFAQFAEAIAGKRDCDVMLEATAKDLALLKLREDLRALGTTKKRAQKESEDARLPL